MRCLVVDDEPLAAQLIAAYVRRTEGLELKGIASSADEAMRSVAEGDVELLLLDIQMPGMTGMEMAAQVPETTRIIFTTAYDQYAIEGYKVNALDYLLKPVSYKEFTEAVECARRHTVPTAPPASQPPATITVKSDYKLYPIEVARILYVEGLKDYIKIYVETPDDPRNLRGYKCIITLMTMKAIEGKLPADAFVRTHRSYIVNASKIQRVDSRQILLAHNVEIPVGDSYRKAFMQRLSDK